MNRSASIRRPFRPSILFASLTHALTRAAIACRRFAPDLLPKRSKQKVPDNFETSLEEAAVSRPGREAGMRTAKPSERRRFRHRHHACHDFFTGSETRRAVSEKETRLAAICEKGAQVVRAEGWEGRFWREFKMQESKYICLLMAGAPSPILMGRSVIGAG